MIVTIGRHGDPPLANLCVLGFVWGAPHLYFTVRGQPLARPRKRGIAKDNLKFDFGMEADRHFRQARAADAMNESVITLYRPVGPKELELVAASGFKRWPPRLPDQPIFYPVTNEGYAAEIAQKWNVRDSGYGAVTRFNVKAEFMRRYPIAASRACQDVTPGVSCIAAKNVDSVLSR